MPSVAPDSNEIIVKQVCRYRRRAINLILFRTLAWSGTILIIGMGLSRFKIPGILILTVLAASSFAAYYLWRNYPQTEQVVRILDQRLSLKEGLVTAFQFCDSHGPFVPLLVKQLSPRLTGARPRQVFPFKMPGVLLAWPFLLTLMIVPAETGLVRFFNFHQNSDGGDGGFSNETTMSLRDTKEDGNGIPSQAEIQNAGRGLDSHSPLTTGGDKFRENDEYADASSGETAMSQGVTKGDDNVIPAQAGIQNAGRGLDSRLRGNDGHLEKLSSEPGDTRGKGTPGVTPSEAGTDLYEAALSSQGHVLVSGQGETKDMPVTGSLKGRAEKRNGYEESTHTAVVQILTRQDIPQEYKEYVKRYFDAIQEEGEIHGEQRRD